MQSNQQVRVALLEHSKRVHPRFLGDHSLEQTEVCPILHPEGMPAISRGLSVRDTPGVGCLELGFAS